MINHEATQVKQATQPEAEGRQSEAAYRSPELVSLGDLPSRIQGGSQGRWRDASGSGYYSIA